LGKKSRAAGKRFEKKVREDLEKKGWIVDRWTNNVEFGIFDETKRFDPEKIPTKGNVTITVEKGKEIIVRNERYDGKLVPAKPKSVFIKGRMVIINMYTGFPDFIAFYPQDREKGIIGFFPDPQYNNIRGYWTLNIGIECKSNGILTKEEKLKCKFYLDNNIFSKVLIIKKGEKRGEIIYEEFK